MYDIDLLFAKARRNVLLKSEFQETAEPALISESDVSGLQEIEEGESLFINNIQYEFIRYSFSQYGFSILLPKGLRLLAEREEMAVFSFSNQFLLTIKRLDQEQKPGIQEIEEHYKKMMNESKQQSELVFSKTIVHKEMEADIFTMLLRMPDKKIYNTVGIIICNRKVIIINFQMQEESFQAWQSGVYRIFMTMKEEPV